MSKFSMVAHLSPDGASQVPSVSMESSSKIAVDEVLERDNLSASGNYAPRTPSQYNGLPDPGRKLYYERKRQQSIQKEWKVTFESETIKSVLSSSKNNGGFGGFVDIALSGTWRLLVIALLPYLLPTMERLFSRFPVTGVSPPSFPADIERILEQLPTAALSGPFPAAPLLMAFSRAFSVIPFASIISSM
ncbi:hypothetical protein OROHE_015998 [Orobanche hederae]